MAIETEVGSGGADGGSSAFESTTGVDHLGVARFVDGTLVPADELVVNVGGVDAGGTEAPLGE